MMNSKLTYAQVLDIVIADEKANGTHGAEFLEKIEALRDSIAKRNASKGSGKPTKLQKENEKLKADILDYMVVGERYSIAELIKGVESLNDMSSQKVSPLLKALVSANLVERIEDKRKIYFSLIAE